MSDLLTLLADLFGRLFGLVARAEEDARQRADRESIPRERAARAAGDD